MTMTDLVILEFLHDHDLELAPKPLYRNLNRHGHDVGYSTVRGRLPKLAEKGLLQKDSDGYYETTDRGQAYLAGEIDASELEDVNG
ncbi:phage PhiH1 repressor-like protein [Halorubrum saccharovorum]|uniref:Phage PhiH1 repressor-like protein n=1 Tax=Halorubrum saccharovorum TaxID=2248 RepID=A0A081EWG0_9EURY|nr:phage PhiH1 repressor-like protein [Halorubrum saccharovorum]